jgi:hypothetical protein
LPEGKGVQDSYDPEKDKKSLNLAKGESLTLRYRFYVQSGADLTPGKAEKIFKRFSKMYK